jgi:hypothetical protein
MKEFLHWGLKETMTPAYVLLKMREVGLLHIKQMTGWRFLTPPPALIEGIMVGLKGSASRTKICTAIPIPRYSSTSFRVEAIWSSIRQSGRRPSRKYYSFITLM